MQEENGKLRELTEKELQQLHAGMMHKQDMNRVVSVGKCFKIQRCYFRITDIVDNGIVAKGITKREYFDSRRPF